VLEPGTEGLDHLDPLEFAHACCDQLTSVYGSPVVDVPRERAGQPAQKSDISNAPLLVADSTRQHLSPCSDAACFPSGKRVRSMSRGRWLQQPRSQIASGR
jgi:hypothetical protein